MNSVFSAGVGVQSRPSFLECHVFLELPCEVFKGSFGFPFRACRRQKCWQLALRGSEGLELPGQARAHDLLSILYILCAIMRI